MADKNWHKKLDVRDPERQIGMTPDGKPIFIDIRELVSSPEETDERWAITLANRKKAIVDQVAHLVLKNGALFIEQTFWNTANPTGIRLYESGNAQGAFAWATAQGYEAIQDGLKTIVKLNGKIIRDMTANVPVELRDAVAERVRTIVKKLPMPSHA